MLINGICNTTNLIPIRIAKNSNGSDMFSTVNFLSSHAYANSYDKNYDTVWKPSRGEKLWIVFEPDVQGKIFTNFEVKFQSTFRTEFKIYKNVNKSFTIRRDSQSQTYRELTSEPPTNNLIFEDTFEGETTPLIIKKSFSIPQENISNLYIEISPVNNDELNPRVNLYEIEFFGI